MKFFCQTRCHIIKNHILNTDSTAQKRTEKTFISHFYKITFIKNAEKKKMLKYSTNLKKIKIVSSMPCEIIFYQGINTIF